MYCAEKGIRPSPNAWSIWPSGTMDGGVGCSVSEHHLRHLRAERHEEEGGGNDDDAADPQGPGEVAAHVVQDRRSAAARLIRGSRAVTSETVMTDCGSDQMVCA